MRGIVVSAAALGALHGQSFVACVSNTDICASPTTAKVGIGPATPTQALQVTTSGGTAGGILVTTPTWAAGNNVSLFMGAGLHSLTASFSTPDVWTGYWGQYLNNLSGTVMTVGYNGGSNVGIGTTAPAHLLHVAGTIGAEEVIVSSTGADYVFQPSYQLKPLAEVGEYIKQHRHLPGIPSAEEVQQKGVGLGEMQGKLLAKVEELTLHMIQAEERSKKLEVENRDLRDRIGRLESRGATVTKPHGDMAAEQTEAQ
jgi:hypothetical protein